MTFKWVSKAVSEGVRKAQRGSSYLAKLSVLARAKDMKTVHMTVPITWIRDVTDIDKMSFM